MNLGSEARMNFPSKLGGNWTWRYTEGMLRADLKYRLEELTRLYGRINSNSGKTM
jgi:4-alpha-glucanotransferase